MPNLSTGLSRTQGFVGEVAHPSQRFVRKSLTEATILEKEFKRFERYVEYWELYKGNHWSESELDLDVPTPVLNKTRTFIDKSVSFVVGKSFKVQFPTKEIQKILDPFVDLLLENSGGALMLGHEAVQTGSVTGDCFLKAVWDKKANFGRGGPKIQVLDSEDVRVRYSFIDYSNNVPDEVFIEYEFLTTLGTISTRREEITDKEIKVFIDNKLISELSGPNILGRMFVVHIRNMIAGKEPYGLSDVVNMENLNKLLNSAIRRFRDDVDYHGDPITLLYGMKIEDLQKGVNKTWGNLPEKGRVENLTLDTDFPAQQKLFAIIEEMMHEQTNIPMGSTKGVQNISNTTGVALQMQYLPLIELTLRKRMAYGHGLKNVIMLGMELMAKGEEFMKVNRSQFPAFKETGIMDAIKQVEDIIEQEKTSITKLKPWNTIEIKFQDFLPKDKMIELGILRDEMALGLESRTGAMERLGKKNIQEKLDEVDEEREELKKKGILPQLLGREGKMADLIEPSKDDGGMRDKSETIDGQKKQEEKASA